MTIDIKELPINAPKQEYEEGGRYEADRDAEFRRRVNDTPVGYAQTTTHFGFIHDEAYGRMRARVDAYDDAASIVRSMVPASIPEDFRAVFERIEQEILMRIPKREPEPWEKKP